MRWEQRVASRQQGCLRFFFALDYICGTTNGLSSHPDFPSNINCNPELWVKQIFSCLHCFVLGCFITPTDLRPGRIFIRESITLRHEKIPYTKPITNVCAVYFYQFYFTWAYYTQQFQYLFFPIILLGTTLQNFTKTSLSQLILTLSPDDLHSAASSHLASRMPLSWVVASPFRLLSSLKTLFILPPNELVFPSFIHGHLLHWPYSH